jgi:ATP-dependent helicase HrpB
VSNRVASLGVETGDDVALLSPDDLLPPELPAPLAAELDRHFPRRLELPDAVYRLEYDLAKKTVTLDQRSGSRKEPPPPAFLPRFAGLTVKIRQGQSLRTVRGRPEA